MYIYIYVWPQNSQKREIADLQNKNKIPTWKKNILPFNSIKQYLCRQGSHDGTRYGNYASDDEEGRTWIAMIVNSRTPSAHWSSPRKVSSGCTTFSPLMRTSCLTWKINMQWRHDYIFKKNRTWTFEEKKPLRQEKCGACHAPWWKDTWPWWQFRQDIPGPQYHCKHACVVTDVAQTLLLGSWVRRPTYQTRFNKWLSGTSHFCIKTSSYGPTFGCVMLKNTEDPWRTDVTWQAGSKLDWSTSKTHRCAGVRAVN